jgi:uncharacterized membrane protein YheB (UPF0754 family)
MNYNIIIPPLIGAAIGYVTNWIAIKMMFRPLKPVKIGKFTLPFTPGIIPKNKGRIAESIALAISNELLTEDDLKNTLLSDEMKDKIKNSVLELIENSKDSTIIVSRALQNYIGEDTYKNGLSTITSNLSNSIFNTVQKANLGNLVATQIEIAANEKMKGSMLGLLGGNAIVSSLTSGVENKVNEYITNNGELLIHGMVTEEFDKYTENTVGELIQKLSNSNIDLIEIIMNIYENFVLKKLSNILEMINISKIITDKINSMDMLELEKLILSIMKKELNALVNLGALIGFILGMVNLLF